MIKSAKWYPMAIYHKIFWTSIKFLPDIQDKKKDTPAVEPENIGDQFGIWSSRPVQIHI
eukprot:SAG11_NODE_327_length_10699_cov_4.828272_4_plen_59_part_00